jgi:predicted ABC-type ATPase
MSVAKQLWLLAGGNGSGKSTFYRMFLKPRGVKFINADIIAKNLISNKSETASYKAARIAERIIANMLDCGESFCFETVFSHSSKVDLAAKAKSLGYEIILVYIHLETPELYEARVSQRVEEGGHNVPVEKIRSRLPRVLENVHKVLPLVDSAWLLDNSSGSNPFRQVASIKKGCSRIFADPMPSWAETLLGDFDRL